MFNRLIFLFLSERRCNMLIRLGRLKLQINWLILLCFCSSLGMFVSLGFWQLDRAAEKRALATSLQTRARADALPLRQAERSDDFGSMSRVLLNGEYDNEVSFLLTFQFFQGQPGYEVLTPFRSDDGSLLLVSRGWLSSAAGSALPAIPEVEGRHQIQAQIYIPDLEVPAATVSDNSWPLRLSRLNVPQAGRLLGEPLYPHVLRLEAGQPGVLSRHWQPVRVSTRTHIAYALQWFGIALLVSVAALLYASNILELIKGRRREIARG
jgi:surfeit locus 1 family protein